MITNIETPILGHVAISSVAVKQFSKIEGYDDDEAIQGILQILQSEEIERVKVPSTIEDHMISTDGAEKQLEFWIHQACSIVFLVTPIAGSRIVNSAIKVNSQDLLFDAS